MTAPAPDAATQWRSPHGRALPAPRARTLLMGVLNLTPDSFSDGGELPTPYASVARARAMIAEGADVLDLGGESTRPGAAAVGASEEMERVLPVLAAIRRELPDVPISIDTYKAEVAEAAVAAGADIINDIWGAAHGITAAQRRAWSPDDPASLPRSPMAETAARLGAPIILMHNRPDRNYGDFWADFLRDLRFSVALVLAAGVPRGQIWLDPGFGFAKEPHHNLEALKHLGRVAALGFPVLLGTSRKSTLGRVLDAPVRDRLDATGATFVWGVQQGCRMARVHDVAAMRRFARMADAIAAGLEWKP